MSKFAVIATIEVQPGTRPEVLDILLAHRTRCLRDEPGTLQFEVLVPNANENQLMLYEVYADESAFNAHLKGASFQRATTEVAGRMLSMTGVRGTNPG